MVVKRTGSDDVAFQQLVNLLDAELAKRDGNEHAFYNQFNQINMLKNAVVLYRDDVPVGCGAIKEIAEHSVEVKRMYVVENNRGQGFASVILKELEAWAAELQYKKCVLETGKRQPEAISLYKKNGYRVIPNFGQYAAVDNSVCFEKTLLPA